MSEQRTTRLEDAVFEGSRTLVSSAVKLARGDAWIAEQMLHQARNIIQCRREEGRRGRRERDTQRDGQSYDAQVHGSPGQPR